MAPKLSVVVPIYDVEKYLQPLLDSIAAQTLTDFEVIMVDDGSTDGSAVIAKSMTVQDPRFRLVEQPNAGLGPARNTGALIAKGEYLAFADSDDLIPPHAYTTLVSTLDRTGSDVATGNVQRLIQGFCSQSSVHAKVFPRRMERIRLAAHPMLLRDRTAWNKVFRRSFWDSHGFQFPAGLYEDSPVTVKAYALAEAIDVLPECVYHWRHRAGSITGRRGDDDNLRQRLRTSASVRQWLAVHEPALLAVYEQEVLIGIDLKVLFGDLPRSADPAGLIDTAAEIAAPVVPAAIAGLPALDRLKLRLLAGRKVSQLLELLRRDLKGELEHVPVSRKGGRWYADFPFSADEPRSCSEVTGELTAVAKVTRMSWAGERLRIEGEAHIRPLNDARVRLWLISPDKLGLRRIPADLDGRLFTAEIPLTKLMMFGRLRPVDWTLYADFRAPGVRKRRSVAFPRTGAQRYAASLAAEAGLRVRLVSEHERFVIQVRVSGPVLTGQHREGDLLVLEGTGRGGALVASAEGRKVEAETSWDGPRFRAELPIGELINASSWTCEIAKTPLEAASTPDAAHLAGDAELVVSRTVRGAVRLAVRRPAPLLHAARRAEDGAFHLSGEHTSPERSRSLVLRSRLGAEEHTVPVAWDGTRFEAVVRPSGLSCGDLEDTTWLVQLGEETVLVARSAMPALPDPLRVREDDGLHLVAERAES